MKCCYLNQLVFMQFVLNMFQIFSVHFSSDWVYKTLVVYDLPSCTNQNEHQTWCEIFVINVYYVHPSYYASLRFDVLLNWLHSVMYQLHRVDTSSRKYLSARVNFSVKRYDKMLAFHSHPLQGILWYMCIFGVVSKKATLCMTVTSLRKFLQSTACVWYFPS